MKFFFFLIILVLIPIPSAFAVITINGTTITTDNAVYDVDTPLTVESLLVETDGFTTRFSTSDSLLKYDFNSTTITPLLVDWDAVSSTQIDFLVTSVVTDTLVDVGGVEIGRAEVDSGIVVHTFASSLSEFTVGVGDLVEIFFEAIVSSSGGGGSNFRPVVGDSSLPIEIVSIILPQFALLGQTVIDEKIGVNWSNDDDLTVGSIFVEESPFTFVFEQNPTLQGDPSGASLDTIGYSYQVPTKICFLEQADDCVFFQKYEIPVEIEYIQGSKTIKDSSQLVVDLSLDFLIVALIVAFVAVPVIYLSGRHANRRKGKSTRDKIHRPRDKSSKAGKSRNSVSNTSKKSKIPLRATIRS